MFAINGQVKFDFIRVTAEYFITGRIFKTPIHGMGDVTAEFSKYFHHYDNGKALLSPASMIFLAETTKSREPYTPL